MPAPLKPTAHRAQLLAVRARDMRAAAPESAQALWRELRCAQLGVRFRREVPLLGRYIGDFVAEQQKLVVEVDGGSHRGRAQADRRRDEKLRRAGWRVVRIDAELVRRDLPEAVQCIRHAPSSRFERN
jgi:very-short-patch-repair endonuclease